ncbi:MAG: hypothetical protein M0Q13_10960 [Methanothrix sp.]|jgi:hypothetical protein|nr:hypothetical protein [Methanothrix sp.]
MEIEFHSAVSLLLEIFIVLVVPVEILAQALKLTSREATILLNRRQWTPTCRS